MKIAYAYFVCAIVVQFSAGICSAQTVELKPAPAGVTIDGNGKEWGTMAYTYDKAKVTYTISNDKDNLYLVIKTNDPKQQSNILGGGVTFAIDTKGRKKSTFFTTFPASPEDKDLSSFANIPDGQMQVRIDYAVKFGKIHAEGFKDITDEEFGVDNSNGIKVSIGRDAGYLVYEEAIPLTLFHAGDQMTKEWAYNIKLNAIVRRENSGVKNSSAFSGAGSAQNSVGGSGRDKSFGSGHVQKIDPESSIRTTTLIPEIDFWGKFTLAKAQ